MLGWVGEQNAYVSDPENLKILAHARSLEKFHGAVNGTASFFQAGSLSVSENGVKNAEGYYRLLRPLEVFFFFTRKTKFSFLYYLAGFTGVTTKVKVAQKNASLP